METARVYWQNWKETLAKLGLEEMAIWFLEAASPLNIIGAQTLYMCQPFFPSSMSHAVREFAGLLEQEAETRAFIDLLKGNSE